MDEILLEPLTGEAYGKAHQVFLRSCQDENKFRNMYLHAKPSLEYLVGKPVDVMSIGAGDGDFENHIVKGMSLSVESYYGLEPIQSYRETLEATAKHWGVRSIWMDGRPFASEFQLLTEARKDYDIVFFNHSLYYMDDPIECVKLALSYLKPGGKVFIFHTTDNGLSGLWKSFYGKYKVKWVNGVQYGGHGLSSEDICRQLEEVGIKSVIRKRHSESDVTQIMAEGCHGQAELLLSFYLNCNVSMATDDAKLIMKECLGRFIRRGDGGKLYFQHDDAVVEINK